MFYYHSIQISNQLKTSNPKPINTEKQVNKIIKTLESKYDHSQFFQKKVIREMVPPLKKLRCGKEIRETKNANNNMNEI
jgi:hypothetical protein